MCALREAEHKDVELHKNIIGIIKRICHFDSIKIDMCIETQIAIEINKYQSIHLLHGKLQLYPNDLSIINSCYESWHTSLSSFFYISNTDLTKARNTSS